MNLKSNLMQYRDAGYPIIFIESYEEDKADKIISEIAESARVQVIEWNGAVGACDFRTKKQKGSHKLMLDEFLETVSKDELNRKIIVIKDMNDQLAEFQTVALLKQLAIRIASGSVEECMIIMISPTLFIPKDLEKYITVLEQDYIDDTAITKIIQKFVSDNSIPPVAPELIKKLTVTFKGLTEMEINNILSLAASTHGSITQKDLDFIFEQKKQMIMKSGILEMVQLFGKACNRIISVLSEECEVRGTDATGIAYNSKCRLHIYKRAVPAHKMRYRLPEDANIIMGHTRMTTQGSEKFNYNNHPFLGTANGVNFALAHNGVLHNDELLRRTENLPETYIQTDSYVAVQLIEKGNTLSSESLKNMAEKTEGSFCYTVLSDRNELYIVKGDNPIALYKFDGFYIYASTEEIMKNALQELNLSKCSRVNVNCGDILKLDSNGAVEIGHFDFRDGFYGRYLPEPDESYLEELAFVYGIEQEDILTLLEFGYDVFDIEEMLCCPEIMHEYIDEIKSYQMM